MRPPRWALAALFALCIGALPRGSAKADPVADTTLARDLFLEGAKLAQEGKWDEARERYKRSLDLKRASLTLYSLGVAQKQVGRLVEARESFKAFLTEPSSPATQPFEQPAQGALKELEARIARLTITVTPADAAELEVRVNGALVPPTELREPRLIDPGEHEITASARGFKPTGSKATARPGEAINMTLALRRWAVDTSVTPVQAPPASPDRSLPLTLIGSGFATFMAGAAVGMIGVLEASDAPTSDGVEARHARSKALIGDVVGGTGIAVLGVGVILLLTQGGSKAPKPSASAVSLFAEGSASGVRVTF